MSTKTKQQIREVTSYSTGIIVLMSIYFCTFYTAFHITSNVIEGNKVSAVANEQKR